MEGMKTSSKGKLGLIMAAAPVVLELLVKTRAAQKKKSRYTRARKREIRLDKRRYRDRWRVEAVFCRLKDFRRIATRYDKLARNFASALALAAVIAFWC